MPSAWPVRHTRAPPCQAACRQTASAMPATPDPTEATVWRARRASSSQPTGVMPVHTAQQASIWGRWAQHMTSACCALEIQPHQQEVMLYRIVSVIREQRASPTRAHACHVRPENLRQQLGQPRVHYAVQGRTQPLGCQHVHSAPLAGLLSREVEKLRIASATWDTPGHQEARVWLVRPENTRMSPAQHHAARAQSIPHQQKLARHAHTVFVLLVTWAMTELCAQRAAKEITRVPPVRHLVQIAL
jgi:hypothetical protein